MFLLSFLIGFLQSIASCICTLEAAKQQCESLNERSAACQQTNKSPAEAGIGSATANSCCKPVGLRHLLLPGKGESLVKWLTNGFCFWSLLIKPNTLSFQIYLQKEVCKNAASKGCNRSEKRRSHWIVAAFCQIADESTEGTKEHVGLSPEVSVLWKSAPACELWPELCVMGSYLGLSWRVLVGKNTLRSVSFTSQCFINICAQVHSGESHWSSGLAGGSFLLSRGKYRGSSVPSIKLLVSSSEKVKPCIWKQLQHNMRITPSWFKKYFQICF